MRASRPNPRRKFHYCVISAIALLLAGIVIVERIQSGRRESPELHHLRVHGNVIARNLQRYVKKTGQFPSKIEDLYTVGDDEFSAALADLCFQIYTKPALKAPPTTTVVVIRCGEQQAIIRKDFHVLVWQ